jgi:hypothetical protein
MGMKRTKNTVIMVIFFILLICNLAQVGDILAFSPSFARQGIINQNNHWSIPHVRQNLTRIDIPPGVMELAKKNDECKSEHGPRPSSISAVTYLSNGKTLNATLWLSGPFILVPSNTSSWLRSPFKEIPWYRIGYFMSIHVHTAYDLGGPDYRSGIEWNVSNGIWTNSLYEYSPIEGDKLLDQRSKYTVPIGQNYVDLSLDLRHLNYPNLYDVLFYATDLYVKDGRLCRMVDITSRVYVPPPEFSVTSIPSTVVVRPGDNAPVELEVKSNTNIKSQVFLYANASSDIQGSIIPNKVFLPPNGVVTSLLNVEVPESAKARTYTLPIVANFSIPTEAKTNRFSTTGEIAYGSNTQFTAQVSNFTVTVLPPFTIQERLMNFYTGWLSPINGIWTFLAGVGAIVAPLIIRKKRNERKSKKISSSGTPETRRDDHI